jgi:hypothetical protein
MPIRYYSSTGALSFAPVTLRDQAVGPLEVVACPTPPDEIIEPRGDGHARRFGRFKITLAITSLTAIAVAIFAGSIV